MQCLKAKGSGSVTQARMQKLKSGKVTIKITRAMTFSPSILINEP